MADETPAATSPFAGLDRALLRETKKPPTQGKGATTRQSGRATSGAPRRARQRPAPPAVTATAASSLDSTEDIIGASTQASKEIGRWGSADHVARQEDGPTAAGQVWDTGVIESLRKTVKPLGDKVSYVRLTDAEKDGLREIVATLGEQGLKTTENEVSRIAIAYLLVDHERNGPGSVVTRVVEALLS